MKIIYYIILLSILTAFLSSTTIITTLAQNEYMYSIKFVCIPTVGPDTEAVFVPQNYSTVINVHNPNPYPVLFEKKAVLAPSEGERIGQISNIREENLQPGHAFSINCNDIFGLFNSSRLPIGDGFVIVTSNVKLDISAVYTTQSSIDVEYIQPRI